MVDWEVRSSAYRLLAEGVSAVSTSAVVGVSRRTVGRWAKLGRMELAQGPQGGAVTAGSGPAAESAGRAYRRLTLTDRSFIAAARAMKVPLGIREIARHLRVAPSTVSREVRRHGVSHGGQRRYSAELAHHRAMLARSRSRAGKLAPGRLRREVVTRLNSKSSPQQVVGELKLKFPDRPELHVSHETIYKALYVQGRGGLRHELSVEKALRTGRTSRVPLSKLPPRSKRPWLEGARLSDRPAEVEDRAVPGHWEGDLVVGPGNSGIVTLVERQTRFVLLGRLPGRRDSDTVIDVLTAMIQQLPSALAKTLTWDQGPEMAQHARFTIATGCPVFFCDPHSPWQRGSNENTNGLIRDFYPKGTNFNTISDDDLAQTQNLLNIRPRATLGFHNPAHKLDELITVLR